MFHSKRVLHFFKLLAMACLRPGSGHRGQGLRGSGPSCWPAGPGRQAARPAGQAVKAGRFGINVLFIIVFVTSLYVKRRDCENVNVEVLARAIMFVCIYTCV